MRHDEDFEKCAVNEPFLEEQNLTQEAPSTEFWGTAVLYLIISGGV